MRRADRLRCLCFAWVVGALVLASAAARAETWQAPVGGKALPLDGRVACAGSSGAWTLEQDGHAVRPPTTDDAVGKAVDLEVAPSAAACATTPTTLTLVALGRAPAIDATQTTLFVDEARVELHGRGLRGTVVRWQLGDRSGEDRCVQPQAEGGGERCAVAVGRGLPADPTASDLEWLPAGARDGPDVVTFDATGRRVGHDERLLPAARIVVSQLVPPDVSIDLAGGTASRIPLVHPEAVVGADCGAASCDVSGDVILVSGLSTVSGTLPVRLRLAPRVALLRGGALDVSPLVQVPVLPCAMSIASGDALRDVDATRVVVRVDSRCAGEARSLRWFSAGRAVDLLGAVDAGGATYVLLDVGRVEGDEIVVTAARGGADQSIVGQARARARALPPPHATLALQDGRMIDFLPTNRPAVVRWAKSQGAGELVLLPLEGVYDVRVKDGATLAQGQSGSGGFVSLRFAWRVPTLPGALATADLAVVTDPVQRPMHEADVPVPLAASSGGRPPIVELLCGSGKDLQRIAPGAVVHIPYDERDACRVVFHRERLPAEAGAQHLQLDIEVTRVSGDPRPDAHVTQPMVLRSGDEPRVVWIKGVQAPFDRATVRVTHTAGEDDADGHEAPSVQYSILFGTGHWRLYGTTAIPTGLFRFSDRAHSGLLSLNLGVLMRATWLDSEGHEGFLGLEAGVMALGLPNDQSVSGNSLTQVATVSGVGLSIPIANRSLATETSINLHAWFEYEVSRAVAGALETGSPFGFVFGPSISIGNVGTNF
jgi:hypothetical protein